MSRESLALFRQENAYRRLLDAAFSLLKRQILAARTPGEIIAALELHARSEELYEKSGSAANLMAEAIHREQGRIFRKLSAGKKNLQENHEQIQFLIARRLAELAGHEAALARALPADIAFRLVQLSQAAAQSGKSQQEITNLLKDEAMHSLTVGAAQAARRGVYESLSSLTKTHSQAIGSNWYIWRDRHDARVRKSHLAISGVLCNWNAPPDPEKLAGLHSYGAYHPGCTYNCRCIAEPILSPSQIAFPVRVYAAGQIIRVGSLRQFCRLFPA